MQVAKQNISICLRDVISEMQENLKENDFLFQGHLNFKIIVLIFLKGKRQSYLGRITSFMLSALICLLTASSWVCIDVYKEVHPPE